MSVNFQVTQTFRISGGRCGGLKVTIPTSIWSEYHHSQQSQQLHRTQGRLY